MIFNNKEEDDYFENTPDEEPKPKPVKQPALRPDDPRYYETDDEWEHLRPASRNWKAWLWTALGAVGVIVLVALYFRYCSPWSERETQYGYVENIAKRGLVFKTYEGVMIPYKSIADTVKPYEGDIVFSAKNDTVAAQLLRLQLANLPARVEIARYRGTLPWRGESKVVIVKADTADVTKIFPVTSGRQPIKAEGFTGK